MNKDLLDTLIGKTIVGFDEWETGVSIKFDDGSSVEFVAKSSEHGWLEVSKS